MRDFDADSKVERAKYQSAFQDERYRRTSGLHIYADEAQVREWLGRHAHDRCVDFGCGNGLSSRLLLDLGAQSVRLVDFIDESFLDAWVRDKPSIDYFQCSLWDPRVLSIGKHDFAVCTDVLEHIPEHRVDEVLDNIKGCLLPEGTAYFRIALWGSTTEAQKKKALEKYGGELHVTVKPSEWWLAKLAKRFQETDFKVWTNPNKPERKVMIAFCKGRSSQ